MVTTDWDSTQSVQAGIRATVKTLLAQRGYLPDCSDEPIEFVLKKTEIFPEEWGTNGHSAPRRCIRPVHSRPHKGHYVNYT